MLTIHCPVCGIEGDETDFHCGGQAHIERPATTDPHNITDEQQRDYLFMRFNPRGLHFERWRCDRGCGKWFHAARDTATLEFKAYYSITEMPPADLMKQATGQWAEFFKRKSATTKAAPNKAAAKKAIKARAKKS
jgi:sarcosine oxidase subunit delta